MDSKRLLRIMCLKKIASFVRQAFQQPVFSTRVIDYLSNHRPSITYAAGPEPLKWANQDNYDSLGIYKILTRILSTECSSLDRRSS